MSKYTTSNDSNNICVDFAKSCCEFIFEESRIYREEDRKESERQKERIRINREEKEDVKREIRIYRKREKEKDRSIKIQTDRRRERRKKRKT